MKIIAEEIRDWSRQVLEVPSESFNGLPPCPYAKQAWLKNKVRFHRIRDLSEILTIKKNCPDDDSVDVVAWTDFQNMKIDEFDDWMDRQNENHQGVWIIGFHPDHPADESLDEFEGNGSPDYALLLVQSHRHLSQASTRIYKKGYYDKYSQADIHHIKNRNKL